MKRIISILIGFLLLAWCPGYAQQYREMINDPNANFYDIQKKFYEYWEEKEKKMGKEMRETGKLSKDAEEEFEGEYYHFKRWEWFMEPRVYPSGKMINPAAKNFQEWQRESKALESSANKMLINNGFWNPAGLSSYVNGSAGYNGGIGRINCIVFEPGNANTIYCGTPSGGLWKTTVGGNDWTPLTDGLPRIGVSGIAINPGNTNQIYILTGDGDGADVGSIGVLKSDNGGVTWVTTGLSFDPTIFVRGYKLLMDPTNSSILFAITNQGIYRTVNSGTTWTNVKTGGFFDCEFKPGDHNIMYASTSSQLWRSTDNGVTWTQVTTGLPASPGSNRTALAVSANNSSYVYILYGGGSGYVGVYRSTDSGVSFAVRSTTPNLLGYSTTGSDGSSQSSYDLTFGVDPANVSIVYVGGIQVWKSTDGAATWTCKTRWSEPSAPFAYNHADQHVFEFNGTTIFTGSDGGIYKSTDGANTFTQLTNTMHHTQIYRIAGTPQNSDLYYFGAQDNGCNKFDDGTNVNTHVFGADGMQCRIDFTNSNIAYIESQSGGMRKTTNGGTSFTSVNPSSGGAWVTPYVMSPGSATTLYAGYSSIYKTTNGGTSWTNVLSGIGTQTSMAIGTNNTNVVYSASGTVLRKTTNGGTSWSIITGTLPVGSASITYIAVSTLDANKLWVTFSGYSSGNKVYESTDGGTTWTNISGSLPNIPVNCIAFEPGSASDALYIGTDVGIYFRNDALGNWIPFRNGLPNVIVNDFHIDVTANKVTAATYGRGIWTTDLFYECPTSLFLTPANNPGSGGYQRYTADQYVESSRQYLGGYGTDVKYNSGDSIKLLDGFRMDGTGGALFTAYISGCPTPPPAGPVMLAGNWEGTLLWAENNETVIPESKLSVKNDPLEPVQIYPNPFTDKISIQFDMIKDDYVSIKIYDLIGKELMTISNSFFAAGKNKVETETLGIKPGVYFISVNFDGSDHLKRLIKL